jgi:hypothetical protein
MKLDRRIIFMIVALAVVVPLLFPLGLPVAVTDETRAVYERLERLEQGSVVMLSFDHEASSLPEVRPLAEAILNHCFRRNIRVVGLALFAEGAAVGYDILHDLAARHDKQYGHDYAYLGYRPQYTAAILGMGESIREVFPTDYDDTPYDDIPLLREIRNYGDIGLVVSVADGSLPTYWVEYAQARYGQEIIAALTAVMVTAYAPYVDAGQISGVLGGLKGAAEYEILLGRHAAGKRGMDAQSLAHLSIAVMIVIGNVVAFGLRRKNETTEAGGHSS